jgi:hypothetical protein
MFDVAMLVFAAIAAIAGIIAVLPLFGFDLRLRGREPLPLEAVRPKPGIKAWLALVLVLLSLGLSAGAFYYFLRPRTVEKIVEKQVPQLCPEQKEPRIKPIPGAKPLKGSGHVEANPITTPKYNDSPQAPQTVINAPQGIGIAGSSVVNNPTVNNFAVPNRHLTEQGTKALAAFASTLPPDLQDKVTVRSVNESEPIKYAGEITAAFEQHTKVKSDFALGWDHMPEGVIVCATDQNAEIFPLAQKIANALLEAGIQHVNFTKCTGVDDKHTMIIVGIRPEY